MYWWRTNLKAGIAETVLLTSAESGGPNEEIWGIQSQGVVEG